jgi:hypothetical protein
MSGPKPLASKVARTREVRQFIAAQRFFFVRPIPAVVRFYKEACPRSRVSERQVASIQNVEDYNAAIADGK